MALKNQNEEPYKGIANPKKITTMITWAEGIIHHEGTTITKIGEEMIITMIEVGEIIRHLEEMTTTIGIGEIIHHIKVGIAEEDMIN